MTRRSLVAVAVLGASLSSPVQAQEYPTRPIRLIISFAGGTDVVARLLAQGISGPLGQPVVVDQRLGAGGNIAHEAVARAAPDGYTLLMSGSPLVLNPLLNPRVRYDAIKDFAPVAMVASIPRVLVVHPSVPAKTLKELVALARRHPGKLNYGSGGVGSTPHLATELLQSLAGMKMLHVPYKSATVALGGAMAGEVDVIVVSSASAAAYVKDGRLRALAVLDRNRLAYMSAAADGRGLVRAARAARHAVGHRRAVERGHGQIDGQPRDARTAGRHRRRAHVHYRRAGRRLHP